MPNPAPVTDLKGATVLVVIGTDGKLDDPTAPTTTASERRLGKHRHHRLIRAVHPGPGRRASIRHSVELRRRPEHERHLHRLRRHALRDRRRAGRRGAVPGAARGARRAGGPLRPGRCALGTAGGVPRRPGLWPARHRLTFWPVSTASRRSSTASATTIRSAGCGGRRSTTSPRDRWPGVPTACGSSRRACR